MAIPPARERLDGRVKASKRDMMRITFRGWFLGAMLQTPDTHLLQQQLRQERAGDTFDMFLDYFAAERLPEQTVRVTCSYLSGHVFARKGSLFGPQTRCWTSTELARTAR